MRTGSVVAAVATVAKTDHRFGDNMAVSHHGARSRPAIPDRIEWVSKAQCRSIDPDKLFVGGAKQREAVSICRYCPVVAECLADALDNQMDFGVWGGKTARERRALLKLYPEVASWSKLFADRGMRRNADESA
jgi:WhiB family transcriptional regulator, redox-sensing transcriptional regulator